MLATNDSLRYLDGTLPGDYGFDPLGLYDPAQTGGVLNQKWLACSEILHGRWAMLAVVGCLAPEALRGINWYDALSDSATNGADLGGGSGALLSTAPWFGAALLAVAEGRRLQEFRRPGSLQAVNSALARQRSGIPLAYDTWLIALSCAATGDPVYPGGRAFNPLRLCYQPETLRRAKVQEVKHGRLAMVAMFGFMAQSMLTHEGPLANLSTHIKNPYTANLVTTLMEGQQP